MYEYHARLHRVIDGDTLVLDIDLGFETTRRITVRLYGINTPERYSPEGKIATAEAMVFLEGKELIVHTFKDKREKYGRYLAAVFANGKSLTGHLLSKGYGVQV